MKINLYIFCLLFTCNVVIGQVDGHFFENYTHKWEVYLEDAQGNQSLNRIWTDFGEIVELGGVKYLHRVQDLYNPDGTLQATWINMVAKETMKPWYFQSVTPSGSNTFITFSDHKVYTTTSNPQSNEFKKDSLSYKGKLYDWNLYGILLCGLTLESNTSHTLPILNPNTLQPDEIKVNILSKETIKTKGDHLIETWKVETDKNLTFWLSKLPPYVVQLQLDMQNGNKLLWYSCF